MRTLVIINSLAGSLINADIDLFRDKIEAALGSTGHHADIVTLRGAAIEDVIDDALSKGAERVVVAGGDGTIRTAAQCLVGTGVALGILPCGTLNRLARDLEVPLDLDNALSETARGQVKRIDVGAVNGQVFLCQSMFGLPVHLAQRRQSIRGKPFFHRAAALARLLGEILVWTRKLTITLDAGPERRRMRLLSLAVLTGQLREEPSLMLRRHRLDHGVLTLYASQHETGLAFAASFLRGLAGRFSDDRQIEIVQAHRLRIDAKHRKAVLSIDGELHTTSFPLEFEIRPQALAVIVPRSSTNPEA